MAKIRNMCRLPDCLHAGVAAILGCLPGSESAVGLRSWPFDALGMEAHDTPRNGPGQAIGRATKGPRGVLTPTRHADQYCSDDWPTHSYGSDDKEKDNHDVPSQGY
jgi:hypothetical protein